MSGSLSSFLCDQGWVEIYYKDKKTKELLVVCNEFESRWEHPTETDNSKIDTIIFNTGIEIEEPTEKEIILKDWKKYILDSN